ncbi:MogA/MoaB family molybdenum cofactor biosynthesis protein [Actinomyces sp. MRS3W]|uniref:MogA/MoaB family molybdenum cofactor biosynthesis protein n=1 Tax=Actinomyces sp. MRS3W TaxID=2800796 RepID=UPI0028FD9DCE|nr:MogA/MoaB family molybdenum cofactor biosynthesis protein [Actinomyces sp. MRS3W]MDU0347523.1 MogA/MoaB family molybdenum cofactor biosynthesis protein [Actinomyces sp. MRS3W]
MSQPSPHHSSPNSEPAGGIASASAAEGISPVPQKGLHPLPEPVKGAVITVSDRCVSGEREDVSGPLAARLLRQHDVIVDAVRVVPDGEEPVRAAIREAMADGARVVLTTGGTGVTPRDLTPEGTAPLLDVRLEGIEAQIRAYGLTHTPLSSLSRGLVGVTGRGSDGVLVVNAPGSRGGVKDTIAVVGPLVPHVLEQLGGGDH